MTILSAREILTRRGITYIATSKDRYTTQCPGCSQGYLNVKIENDRVAWYCHSCKGGSAERYEQADAPAASELGEIKAVYDYTDESGALLFQVLRFEPLGKPKQFRQRKDPHQKKWSIKGVRIVPYRLPELIEDVAAGHVVFVVEGEKDANTLRKHGVPATCNPMGAGKWWPEFNSILRDADVVICADNDQPGRDHALLVARNLHGIARRVRLLDLKAWWPGIEESDDLSDWYGDGHDSDELWKIVEALEDWKPAEGGNGHDVAERRGAAKRDEPPPLPAPEPCTLAEAHAVFRRHLGADYDIATLDAMLAVAAAERLPGDPPWLLIISGPGNAKTETVQATSRLGAHIVSTITSDAALLSATPRKQRSKTATGGLLRKIGERGILTIKDVTSILSMDRNARGAILAALREIHDGTWVRNVGTDGGQTLTWKGRIVVIGAVTTAWDQAHAVIASMGDRFVTIRSSSHTGRVGGGLRAMRNTGGETKMREELAAAVAGVVTTVNTDKVYQLTEDDEMILVQAADVVTRARTGVELDYRGDVIDSHDPEMPTRFAKQLTMILRGAVAVGMPRLAALRLVVRCARDSMPQLRLAVLRDVAANPDTRVVEVRRRLQKPRATIDRTLQALHILGLLTCREEPEERGGKTVHVRHYDLSDDIDLDALADPAEAAPLALS